MPAESGDADAEAELMMGESVGDTTGLEGAAVTTEEAAPSVAEGVGTEAAEEIPCGR